MALVLGCSSPATLTVKPATLRASTLMTMKCTELVKRPSTEVVIITKASARRVLLHAPCGPSCDRFAFAPLAAVALSLTPAMERAHHEARQKGNRNPGGGEGTWGTIVGQEQVWGRVRGRLQTILPRLLRSPNLACKMRPRHAARVQRPRGQTPEAIRPEPQTSMTRSRTDTLTHRQATRPPTHTRKPRSECGPRSFYTQDVRTPLAGNRGTVRGCLVEARVSEPGSGTRTLPLRVPVKKYLWGFYETICEQHMSRHNRTD